MTNMDSASAWTGSQHDRAVTFDGSDDFITVADPSNDVLDFDTGDFSYSVWLQSPIPGANTQVLYKRTGSAPVPGYNLALLTATGRVSAVMADTSAAVTVSPTNLVATNTWRHVCVTAQRTSVMTVYIDGLAEANGVLSTATGSISNSAILAFGASSAGANPYGGRLANIRIYHRALSAVEVRSLYADPFVGMQRLKIRMSPASGTLSPGHTYQHRHWDAHHLSFT